MKTLFSPKPHKSIRGRISRSSCHALTVAGLILTAASVSGLSNRVPIVSWLPDQRVIQGSGTEFAKKFFRIIDPDGPTNFTFTKQSTNSTWYSAQNVAVSQCTPDDVNAGCSDTVTGYKVTFMNTPDTPDATAITLKVQDTGTPALSTYISFTLRVDPALTINPPSIGMLPNRALQLSAPVNGNAVYTTKFVIGDLDENDEEDIGDIDGNCSDGDCDFTFTSSNHMLLDDPGLGVTLNPSDDFYAPLEGPRSYTLTATTKLGATGFTTVTVELQDPDLNKTSTSFVLRVFPNSDAPPSFGASSDGTFLVCPVPTPNPTPPQYHFTVVSNDSTPVGDLRVTAKSSNTKLVSNDSTQLFCSTPDPSTGVGTVTIVPTLPLPTPSPGVPQTSTITLTVTDGSYQRQSTFLYVVSDATSPAIAFARPAGVYLLDASQEEHRENTFLTGETLAVSWADIETSEGMYSWGYLNARIAEIPQNDISLNIQEEACYIADDDHAPPVREFPPWCDGGDQTLRLVNCNDINPPCNGNGVARPVPWDSYLQERRDEFYEQLRINLNITGAMSRISTINPNLPGAEAGIRRVSVDFETMDGYTRQRLLETIQDELRTLQDKFPGKLIQIGFFKVTDRSDPPLWKWLYRDASNDVDANGVHLVALGDEFNGIKRPRVSFFQENLAATRTLTPSMFESSSAPNYITPASTTAYTSTPMSSFVPAFAYYAAPTNDQYRNGTTFQSLTPWSNPFMDPEGGVRLINTINGSPNDAMEAAFNSYLSQYLEVYPRDVDEADPPPPGIATLNAELWKGQLQSWRDYLQTRRDLAPIEGPAGLDVVRNSSTENVISWYAVYGASSYTLLKRDLGESPDWATVNCVPTETHCTDTTPTGRAYSYRVRANGTNSASSYVGVFLSESDLDGYVEKKGSTLTALNNEPQPGIHAGEGTGGPLPHWKGFLSFKTGLLGSTAAILSAKLRLNQATDGTHFGSPSQCMVDIKKGSFNNSSTLEALDWNASPTTANAFVVTNEDFTGWFEAELTPSSSSQNIGIDPNEPDNHTQFRIYFPNGNTANRSEGWYSGESSINNGEPQLIVRYSQ